MNHLTLSLSLDETLNLLIQYKYFILFPIIVVEGPIVTVIAGFLSSLGYLNLLLTFLVVVVGDLGGDCIYYAIGRYGRMGFIEKWGHYVGITVSKIKKIEDHFDKHSGKTLIGAKITHAVGSIILVSAGISKMPLKKFIWYNFIATIPKSLFFLLLGYYFGQAFFKINSYFRIVGIISFVITIVLMFYFLYFKKDKIL